MYARIHFSAYIFSAKNKARGGAIICAAPRLRPVRPYRKKFAGYPFHDAPNAADYGLNAAGSSCTISPLRTHVTVSPTGETGSSLSVSV